jgi:probable rRNA maturation factor
MHTNAPTNEVTVQSESVEPPSWSDLYRTFITGVLEAIGAVRWSVSFVLTDDETIRRLNSQYRNRDEVTDVLTFVADEGDDTPPLPEGEYRDLGDVVIDLDQVYRQADELGVPREQELRRMTIHGILHLNGETHSSTDFSSEPMLIRQESILSRSKERLF